MLSSLTSRKKKKKRKRHSRRAASRPVKKAMVPLRSMMTSPRGGGKHLTAWQNRATTSHLGKQTNRGNPCPNHLDTNNRHRNGLSKSNVCANNDPRPRPLVSIKPRVIAQVKKLLDARESNAGRAHQPHCWTQRTEPLPDQLASCRKTPHIHQSHRTNCFTPRNTTTSVVQSKVLVLVKTLGMVFRALAAHK